MSERRRARKQKRRPGTAADVLAQALAAASDNRRPDVSASDDLGVIAAVDPSESEELLLVGRGPPMRLRKAQPARWRVTALRDDPIGRMAKRGHLGAGAEAELRLHAARHWQALYERAEIGGARGIDPSRDVVDGGGFAMPDTDDRLRAQKTLNELRRKVGRIAELNILGSRLLTWVLAENLTLAKVAAMLGVNTHRVSLVRHLAGCLDIVAGELGLGNSRRVGPRRRRDRFDRYAQAVGGADFSAELQGAVFRATKLRESKC